MARAGATTIASAGRITFHYNNLTGFESPCYLISHAARDSTGASPADVTPQTVRLEFGSDFDMVDFVQVVSDRMCRMTGIDDDESHWVSVAVRESVVNAIKHGNKNDPNKQVIVEFSLGSSEQADELVIRIEDQGEGFVPEDVANPLAPENILKSSGRGIFLIRSFMNDVRLQKVPGGGMEVRMVKTVPRAAA